MEDDNAVDIIKWLCKETTKVDYSGILKYKKNEIENDYEAKLRGNLFVLKPINTSEIPLLYICENISVGINENNISSFYIKFGDEKIDLTASSKDEVETWLVKLATCSYRIVQAELDQAMHKYYNETTRSSLVKTKLNENNFANYFLSSPFKKDHVFCVYRSIGVPHCRISCCETMYESKLSLIVPLDIIKLAIRWSSYLRDDFLNNLWSIRNNTTLASVHNAIRHLNSNIEVYTQATEFMEAYVGPSFRPSVERYRMAFAAVPTNLHVQSFEINNVISSFFLTCGATSAVPLRFLKGGLYSMRNRFYAGLRSENLDYINECRFNSRRKTLLNIKRRIGELTRQIDAEWHVAQFGIVDKIGLLIFSEVKQLYETVCDIVQSFPNISYYVDNLCKGGCAEMTENALPDALLNQLDLLEASMISLTSKMAVIDSVNDNSEGRESFNENAKSALNFTLDAILCVVESLLVSQLYSLVDTLCRPIDCQTFFNIQLRHDLLLSQAVTIVTTALLTQLQFKNTDSTENNNFLFPVNFNQPLISYFSFLSCYRDEKGMIEDTYDIWKNFANYVQFRYIPASSSVSQTCIPQFEGDRTALKVSIPLSSILYEKFLKLKKETTKNEDEWFRVQTIFWNLGINYEATLASKLGDISLEEEVNRTALNQIKQYITNFSKNSQNLSHSQEDICTSSNVKLENSINLIEKMFNELKTTVDANPSNKNITIFPRVIALVNALNGINIFSCKSGKDRTSMAATLEEGRLLKEICGISQQQMFEVVDCLRQNGVRRENCRKNIGKPLFSFGAFQLHFLPKEFIPPNGTYAEKVSS